MTFEVLDAGCIDYDEGVNLQRSLLEEVASGNRANTLVLVEHPPVLTLGASFHVENLLLPIEEYARNGIAIVRTDRGGDVTYHGPGQLVIYPIFNLIEQGKDLHKWLRNLEETVLLTLHTFGIEGRRFPPHTGAWVQDLKIAAIGIKVKKWVSMHGIAINCNNDLSPFATIIPCGIQDYGVTSLTQELGIEVTVEQAKPVVTAMFTDVFSSNLGPS